MGDQAGGAPGALGLETTIELVRRAKTGDTTALDALCARYLAPLRRWARNRLPAQARDLVDTDDIVQDTLIKTVRNLEWFDANADGGLHAYLRRALGNRIRDEIKRTRRAPPATQLLPTVADGAPSPIERVLGAELMHRYENALDHLAPPERDAVVARNDFGLSYKEIATAFRPRPPSRFPSGWQCGHTAGKAPPRSTSRSRYWGGARSNIQDS